MASDKDVHGHPAGGEPPKRPPEAVPPPIEGLTVAFKERKKDEPSPLKDLGVEERMPPLAGAGVGLARLVLTITAGAIVLLLGYLLLMELIIGANVAGAYKQILNPSRIGSEFYALGRLERFSVDLNAARKDPALKVSEDSLQNAQSVVRMAGELPSVTSIQKAQLSSCVPLPTDSTRNDKLDGCIGIAESIRRAALEAAASVTNAQVAGESANKIYEQRQSLHQFWIQAAQLILLNLLLPLLTALFGYIFGTQQRARSTHDDIR